MVNRQQLISFIYSTIGEELLTKALQKDELANGVQILGDENVKKVTLGTSLNEDFLNEAVKAGSNFCIFHHGFDPRTYKSRYPTYSQKRLRLISNTISPSWVFITRLMPTLKSATTPLSLGVLALKLASHSLKNGVTLEPSQAIKT